METGKLNLVNKRQLKGCTNKYQQVHLQFGQNHFLFIGTDKNVYVLSFPINIPDNSLENYDQVFIFKNFKTLESDHSFQIMQLVYNDLGKNYELILVAQFQFEHFIVDFDSYFFNQTIYLCFIDLQGQVILRQFDCSDQSISQDFQQDEDLFLTMKETRRSMASQVFQSSNLFNQQKNEKNIQKQNVSAVNKTFVENNKEQLKDDSKEDLQKNQDNKYMTGKMKQIFSNYTLEDCINLYTASSFCRFYITDQNFNFTNIPTKSQKNNNMMIKSSSEGTSNYRKNSDNQFLFDIKSNQRNLNLIITNTNGECYDFDNIQVNQLADINVLPLVNIRNAGITGFDMFVQKNGDMDLFVSYFNGSLINYGKRQSENQHKWKLKLNQPLNANHYGVFYCKSYNENEDLLFLISDNIIEQYQVSNYSIN